MNRCTFCNKLQATPCTFSGQAEFCEHNRAEGEGLAAVAEALEPPAPSPNPAAVAEVKTQEDIVNILRKASQETPKPTSVQVGGDHYKTMAIQPLTYIQANDVGFEEGNVIKYVSRWKKKGGVEDLKKARDILDKKIAFEEEKARRGLMEYLSGLFKSV